ncbi:MAG: hypothetical protein OEY07_16415, partial [Gammaproteobacteria bacterium]|nr:hypothetical protein [Gammaproteobacteria bacterium]
MPSFLQFGSIPFIYYPMAYFAILLGGWWSLGGILFVVVTQVAVDNLTPVDKRLYHTDAPGYLNLLVYLHIPLGMLLLYLLVWQATPGDMLTTGALLSDLFGTWVMARHTNLDQFGLISCALLC